MKRYCLMLDDKIVEEANKNAKKQGLSLSAYTRVALVEKNKRR